MRSQGPEPEIDHFVMAITAAEVIVRHMLFIRWLELPVLSLERENSDAQGQPVCRYRRCDRDWFGRVWVTSPSKARAPSLGQGIDPLQVMMNAKGLATAEFVDYTFVFH